MIVGAGFAGLYMLHRLRETGFTVRVFEAGSGVGGTWYWNRYPGARCDVESVEYSYSFSPRAAAGVGLDASATPPSPRSCATSTTSPTASTCAATSRSTPGSPAAAFDETAQALDGRRPTTAIALTARFVVMATGCLSSPNTPEIPGLDDFKGATYHTGHWPHEGVDFTGKRVGVIGTGSSAIQSIPIIAEQASHLTVFQRTANYSVPAHNGPLDPA